MPRHRRLCNRLELISPDAKPSYAKADKIHAKPTLASLHASCPKLLPKPDPSSSFLHSSLKESQSKLTNREGTSLPSPTHNQLWEKVPGHLVTPHSEENAETRRHKSKLRGLLLPTSLSLNPPLPGRLHAPTPAYPWVTVGDIGEDTSDDDMSPLFLDSSAIDLRCVGWERRLVDVAGCKRGSHRWRMEAFRRDG